MDGKASRVCPSLTPRDSEVSTTSQLLGSDQTMKAALLDAGQSLPETGLDGLLLKSLAWSGSVRWLAQAVSWVSTLILAHLLAPEDYGLVGMATVYFGLVAMINEFGLGTAVVTLKQLEDDELAQVNSVSVLLGIASFAISCLVAFPLATFYRSGELRLVVVVMSTTLLVSAFKTVPYAILQKSFQFKKLALLEGAQALLQPIVTICLAAQGLGYWALVLGGWFGAGFSTVLLVWACPLGFIWPRISKIKETLTFSWQILVSRLSWYVYSNADFVVAGRVLGQAALGAYTFAWTLANVPVDKISSVVVRTTPAFFAAYQNDQGALRRYLTKTTEGLAMITAPIALGVALVASDFVPVLLGEKWNTVVLPLQILALHVSLRTIAPLIAVVLTATRKSRFLMYTSLMGAVVLPFLFYLGSRWGTAGIAAAWLIGLPLVYLPNYWLAFKTIGLSSFDYLRALGPTVTGSVGLIGVVLALKMLLPQDVPPAARLAASVLAGGLAYVGVLWACHRDRLQSFVNLMRSLRS
jgi:teichuronic acid exporter